ncbi:acyltransferase [uncultured Psychroserpens sp.]|uniref:acyltransferase family protein n=1 Tax=uncultured Psychroserpens sp. TaxID=255436 RepID=UPI002618F771|nr:acyltransferase [uncultured Psychroserpens sp.]
MAKHKYFSSVIALRGLAALVVGLFHFTKGFSHDDSVMKMLTSYGWMGVEVFFVISGFVIPYSLLKKGYKLKHYGKFLLKRIVRIHPAYVLSIFGVIILNYLSTQFQIYEGKPFQWSTELIAQHFFYVVEFFDNVWLNPVYWTLAVEFHYYIIIGLLIAVWNLSNKNWIAITFVLFVMLSFVNIENVKFLRYTDIFAIGTLCAFLKKEIINKGLYLIAAAVLVIIISYNHGIILGILTFSSSIIMAFYDANFNKGALLFLGNISYSLYLLHVPIGGRIINIAKRYDLGEAQKILVILFAMTVSIIAAWMFYILVEKPSHKWSQRIKVNS